MRKKDDPIDILFNFHKSGGLNNMPDQLNTTLPQGPEYDSFNMHILVKIIDNSGGMIEYQIPTLVNVSPNTTLIQFSKIFTEIQNYDTLSNTNKILSEGDLCVASQIIYSISADINSECNKDKNNLRNSSIIILFRLYRI